MTRTPTYEDDYSDDFAYGCDEAGYYVLEEEYEEPYYGFSSFTEIVEANSIYAGVAERAFDAARKADDRKYNHADCAQERERQRDFRAANPEYRAQERDRKRDFRAANPEYCASDNARRSAAHKAERAANPEAVREATRKRVAALRARKRAQAA